jgi:Zn-dependent M28 family amino/carboxypeptidase
MRLSRRLSAAAAALVMAVASLGVVSDAGAGPHDGPDPRCNRNNNSVQKLLECVTLEGTLEHLEAFQAIADANGGTRASGTPGYDASVDYVVARMEAAGYEVTVQPFDFFQFEILGPSALEQTAPATVTYVEDVDFSPTPHSAPGDVTAPVVAVDLALGVGNASTSGCEADDFLGFPAGSIALIQRGTCTFELKAENAAAAGAVGVVFFNQGNSNDPSRLGIPAVTLGNGYTGGIPAVNTTYALGVELSATAGLEMRLFANVSRDGSTTYNVLAESGRGDPGNVVMAGAHLDSVAEGPGINDNGSGSAALLEVAEGLAKYNGPNQLRFAWWGAEEGGLVGSTHYVNDLATNAPDELDAIEMYLNFDMVGSPNYGLFVYDGDGSGFGLVGPDGSDEIEASFEAFYAERGVPSEPTAFSGRSDYQAFIANGIPSGGLFTGAEELKTPEQVAKWGGEVGVAYDPCYHAACDTIGNVSHTAIDINVDAIAQVVFSYASGAEVLND